MAKSLDTGTATIEVLYAAVEALGSPEHTLRAKELLKGSQNVGIGLSESVRLHRVAMIALLAEAEWKKSFTDEAKEEGRKTFEENFRMPEKEWDPYSDGERDISVWF